MRNLIIFIIVALAVYALYFSSLKDQVVGKEPENDARDLYEKGRELFEIRDYEGAREFFEESLDIIEDEEVRAALDRVNAILDLI